MTNPSQPIDVCEVRQREGLLRQDIVAIEEPLEIRLGYFENGQYCRRTISITMRTPGNDNELAVGFLFTEGILQNFRAVERIEACGRTGNAVRVELKPSVAVNLTRLERHFYTSSSCGVCGKTSIEAIRVNGQFSVPKETPPFEVGIIHEIPSVVRLSQPVFDRTGGLHAAALFGPNGQVIALREDVGRHNAVDKLIGTQFLASTLPLTEYGLFLSGRASFELVQKAVVAGIPFIASVGAPSSLAVELAIHFDITLLGFVRDHRFNIYHGEWRLRGYDS